VTVPVFPRRRIRGEGVALEPGERVLASAVGESGVVIATNTQLLVPRPGGHDGISWDSVDRATWNGDGELLTITQTAPLGSRPLQHRLRLEAAEPLLDVVREQVTASVVISRYVPVHGELGVRVTGRRLSGRPGLRWVVAPDAGLPTDDPGVRGLIDQIVKNVRAEVE
jgi:hypothetical protein